MEWLETSSSIFRRVVAGFVIEFSVVNGANLVPQLNRKIKVFQGLQEKALSKQSYLSF